MKKILSSLLMASSVFLLSGCLKDKGFEDQKYGIQIAEVKGVTFAEAATSPLEKALNVSTTAQTLSTSIHIEADKPPTQDVHVTIVLNPTLVSAAGFTAIPAGTFNVPLSITIPAGKMSADVVVTIPNTTTFNPSLTYAIGFTISSVDAGYTIASNFKDIVISFSIKNKYDGHYRVTGTFVDLTNPTFTSVLPNEVDLVTSGPNSVTVYRNINGAPLPAYLFSAAGAGTYYGSFGVTFTFDANDNLVSVVNFFGQPSPNNRWAFIDPTGVNKYDPAAKTIKAKYTLNQPTAATVRSRFDETYTYMRPR